MEIETSVPDLTVRWDNTVRVNLGARVESRSSKIGNTAIADEGTYSFDKGDFVAKRIDLLSELDVVWQKRYGVRISGAGWYDAAYGDKSQSNPNPPLSMIPATSATSTAAPPSASITAAPASCSTPSSSAGSTSARFRCRPSSAATPCTGASRCCSAATCTASPIRRTRSTCRRASPLPAPRPRSCSGR
jgi:hypothetical protein